MKIKALSRLFFSCLLTGGLTFAMASCGDDDGPGKSDPENPENPGGSDNPDDPDTPEPSVNVFAKGADISWVTELEHKGYSFYPSATSSQPMELTQLLHDNCGVNSIRLRVWVNPTDGWNNLNDVIAKARRAKNLNMRVMIDFHLSDTWADPGNQKAPAQWVGFTPVQTAQAITDHVSTTLAVLKNEDVDVAWVQIGNETTPGMLFDLGGRMSGNNAGEFPRYLNAGYDAVKSVYPEAKVIVHLDKGQNYDTYKWFFDLLKANNAKYDMIGMSLYPEIETGSGSSWKVTLDNQTITNCISNITALNQRYGKKIMICEIGFHFSNEAGAASTIKKFMDKFGSGDVLEGIFYWEPEAPEQEGYKKGAFKDNHPTSALSPFMD